MAERNQPISARVCAILSVVIAGYSIWAVLATARDGGSWFFSILGAFVPLLFAAQGFRMSRLPDARWPTFSLVTSIVGAALGVVSLIAFFWLYSISGP